MNFKRARFWRNLLLFSALSSAASLHSTKAEDGVSRTGDGAATQTARPNSNPGTAVVPGAEGYVPLSSSPYMPLDPGDNFNRPMPPALPPAYETLRNSRRDAIGPRFDVGQFLNDRLGVDGGDTNFNFLLPFLVGSDHEVLFVDARGLVSQSGRGGASAGLGYRVYAPDMDRVLGISGWVDYDDGNNRTYQQAGLSFESLGRWIDVRLNGYVPFGRDDSVISRSFVGDPFFGGSNLLVNQRTASESAFYGMDAEIGGPLPVLGRYGVSGYVGGYWLDSQTDDTAAGPRVRFEANVTDNFRVNVTASNDSVFGTNAWVNFQMTLPDGRARRWFRPIPVEDKLLMTVNRDYRVHAHTRIDVAPTPVLMASGANAGQAVSVVFVDPDRMINGTGTLESPLNRFAGFVNSPSNSLLIVDGSASSTPVRGNVTLFSDQKLVSTSILAAGGVQLDTNLGLITLPSPTGFGDATPVGPILMSPTGGTLVTLAGSNIEVAGFRFDGTTGNGAIPHASGIVGTNIVNFNIHHNAFENYTNGVVLNNATGTGFFQANVLTGTPGVSNDGFRLTNSGVGTLNLFADTYTAPPPAPFGPGGTTPVNTLPVVANIITGNDGAGARITARDRAVINAHVVGNTINSNGQGLILDAAPTRSVINGSIADNTIDGNRGEDRNLNGILDPGEDLNGDGVLNPGNGILLTANASTLNLAQLGEDSNANGRLDPTEDTNGNGILDLSEDTNGNGLLDLSEDVNDNGLLDGGFLVTNNTITNNTGDGIAVNGVNNSIINMIATRNRIGDLTDFSAGNLGRGMSITADSGTVSAQIGYVNNEDGNFNGQLDTEDTNGNGRLDFGEDIDGNGLLDTEDTNGNGTLDAADPLDGNVFMANQGGGVLVDLSGTAVGNIVTLNNVIGNGDGSLNFFIDGDTSVTGFSFTNTSQPGINLSSLTWDIQPAGLAFNTVSTISPAIDFTVSSATVAATGFTSVNGNSTPNPVAGSTNLIYSVADQSQSLALQYSSFGSVNGVLDVGEDANNNGRLDPGEDRPQFAFDIDVDGFPASAANAGQDFGNDFIGSTVDVTFSSGHVLLGSMQAVPGNPLASQFVATSPISNLVSGPGIALRASGSAVLNNPTVVGNDIRFQGGAGFTAQASEDAQINNLLVQGNTIQNNGHAANGGGISLNTLNVATASISASILNNQVSNNFGAGISATADFGLIDIRQIDNNTLTGNTTGIALNALNNGSITTRITSNTVTDSTADGIALLADTGSITLNQYTTNIITNSGGNGLVLEARNGGTINNGVTEDINGNLMLDAGEDVNGNGLLDLGFAGKTEDVNNNGILDPTEDANRNGVLDLGEDTNNNGVLDLAEDLNNNGVIDLGNGLFNNAGSGLLITGTDGNFNLGTISDLTIARTISGTDGITIDVTDSVLSGSFISNLLVGGATVDPITGVASNVNTGAGFSLTATGTPGNLNNSFAVTVESNQIVNNAGAGISIVMRQDAFGTFAIRNNTITRTVNDLSEDLNGNNRLDRAEDTNSNGVLDSGEDVNLNGVLDPSEDRNANGVLDTNAILSGEGIFVQMVGTPVLPNARGILSDSVIEGNIIGGSTAAVGNASHGIAFDVQEETTLRNLAIGRGNLIVNNGGDGINFRRRDNVVVEDVVIFQNLIDSNGEDLDGDGVLGPLEDRNGNGQLDGDGIDIAGFEGGGSILGFDLQENEITRNLMSGVHLHVAADARLHVNIARNLIDANGTTAAAALANFASGRGILTTENFGHSTDMREIGGEWLANTITNNVGQGIRLDGTSTNIFNEIEKNLQAQNLMIGGNLIDSNGLDGILVNGPGHLTIDSNTITNNGVNVGLALGTAADPATTGSDLGNGIAIRSVMIDEFGNVANQLTSLPEDMTAPGSTLDLQAAGPKSVEILRNLIQGNADDGLEIRHANNPSTRHDVELHPGFFPVTVIARENTIELNRGRGVDILNQGGVRTPEDVDGLPPETGADDNVNPPVATLSGTSNQFSPTDSTIRLLDNKIASNAKEGIYVVNTASLTQGQSGNTPVPDDSNSATGDKDPTRGLNDDGEVDSVPRLALEVDHNLIIKNGQRLDVDAQGNPIDTITGSGLVIRVGTSDNEAPPLLLGVGGFSDFASAPGDPSAVIFGETGFRNADEILAATGVNFAQLGFFNRLQPGGVVAKVTNNGLNDLGQRDSSSGFEGNFGADVYIESFRSTGVGAQFPVVARLDMIFEHNAGDSLDVTNFGAFFDQNPQRNGQRLAGLVNIPGVALPLFGRVAGVHNGSVLDDPATGLDDATANSFFARDQADPTDSPLDDRTNIYNQREIVMTVAPDTDTDSAFVGAYSGLPANLFSLNQSLPAAPSNNDPFRVELSSSLIFDVILFTGGDPQFDTNAAPRRANTNLQSNVLAGAFLVFIDELGVPDAQQPVRSEQATIANNFALDFGVSLVAGNTSQFHIGGADNVSNVPQAGQGPVASNSELPGLTGLFVQDKTSNQTLVLPAGGLSRAPRDGNLFVITTTEFGRGPSAFRVAGATVAAQAELGINVDTNAFTHNNLGFDDAVSLDSTIVPQLIELPFEWDVLPDDNRTRIQNIFSPLSPLPAAPPTFKDFTFRRIVFP